MKIRCPRVPNFLSPELEDGKPSGQFMPLYCFEDFELEDVANRWRDALFKRRDEQAREHEGDDAE